jgi:hypothetical protein
LSRLLLLNEVSFKVAANGKGLYAGWELGFRLPGPLLIKNMMLKLRTNDQLCLSSPKPMPRFAIS